MTTGAFWLDSFSATGCPGFETTSLQIELRPDRTVLVGKNGAGKSAVVSTIHSSLRDIVRGAATAVPFQQEYAKSITCRVCNESAAFFYTHSAFVRREVHGDEPHAVVQALESCVDARRRRVWSLKNGLVDFGAKKQGFILPPGMSLLAVGAETNPVSLAIQHLFAGVQLVPAGVPRSSETRMHCLLSRKKGTQVWSSAEPQERLGALLTKLANIVSNDRERHHELMQLLNQVGLESLLGLHELATMNDTNYGLVTLAGEQVSFLSDGTIRVLEILVALTDPRVRLLLLEEPETGIHPGLLQRLLAVVTSYSATFQVVVSTHSPYVVQEFEPVEVRFIERTGREISVRALDPDELEHLERYLNDEGTMGEYIFDTEEL